MRRAMWRLRGSLALTAVVLAGSSVGASVPGPWPCQSRRHAILTEATANADDLYLGASYAYTFLPRLGLAAGGSFAMRPYRDWVRERLRPHVYMQMHEIRYVIGLELSDELAVGGPFSLYTTFGAAYTGADYEGTTRTPDQGWTPILDAGFALNFPVHLTHFWVVRVGYRYTELRADENGWMYVALGLRL